MRRFEFLVRRIERKANMPGQRFSKAGEGVSHCQSGPGGEGTLTQRQAGIADQHCGVRAALETQPLAGGAPAQRAVEGKMVWVERLIAATALVAGEVLAEALDFPVWLR